MRVYSYHLSDEWKQIGHDITEERNGDMFGISLSDYGKTIAVGAYGDNVNGIYSGSVRVFRLYDSKSAWMQLGEDIHGEEAGDNSGWLVSLSGDGNTVAIGSPDHSSDDVDYIGQVRVFVLE